MKSSPTIEFQTPDSEGERRDTSPLRKSIVDLKRLMSNPGAKEIDFHKYIKNNYKILFPEYSFLLSETVILTKGNEFRADFILVKKDGTLTIVEIKTPSFNFLRSDKKNFVWSKEAQSVIAQAVNYADGLSDESKENYRTKIKKLFNIDALFKYIDCFIIAGCKECLANKGQIQSHELNEAFQQLKYHYKRMNLTFFMYDELLEKLETLNEVIFS